jgi:hypothetical protein
VAARLTHIVCYDRRAATEGRPYNNAREMFQITPTLSA